MSKTGAPPWRWLAAALGGLALAVVAVACAELKRAREDLPEPRSYAEVTGLIRNVRSFEAGIGFSETKNFGRFSDERRSVPFCGYAPRFYLPYSYEDPAIRWASVTTEEECRAVAGGDDLYFGESEAVGESASPVTPAMLTASVGRLTYLVVHEDCHDQFDLPFGVEEPLCNVIAYRALPLFARSQYGPLRTEYYAIGRYAAYGSNFARSTIRFYDEIAGLYAQHGRLASDPDAILRERARIFGEAARALSLEPAAMNNVVLANAMTYSRHYPFLEDTLERLDGDLGRFVAFFRAVDKARPKAADAPKDHGLTASATVEYLRANETSVVDVARRSLREISVARGNP